MIAAFIRCETEMSPFCLTEISGRPVLGRVFDRVRLARRVHSVNVLTSDRENDDSVARFCEAEAVGYFRVEAHDFLKSLQKAGSSLGAEAAVFLLGDCPLIDPQLIDRAVGRYLRGDCDYVSTAMERTFPVGMDVEVFRVSSLELSLRYAASVAEHEDPSLYLRRGGKFRRANITFSRTEKCEDMDWTFRSESKRKFFERVLAEVEKIPDYRVEDIVAAIQRTPEIAALEAGRVVKCRE